MNGFSFCESLNYLYNEDSNTDWVGQLRGLKILFVRHPSHTVFYSNPKQWTPAPAGVAQLVGHRPAKQKVVGLI